MSYQAKDDLVCIIQMSIPDSPYTAKLPFVKGTEKVGSLEFHTATVVPSKDVEYKGFIFFVHGFAEFGDIYVQILDDLALSGYECFIYDQRGHGNTSPGVLKGHSNERYTFEDLDFLVGEKLEEIKTRPNQKFYLFGHSMGGGIILNYAVIGKYKDQITGIVACGPLVQIHPKTKPNIFLRATLPLIARFLPNLIIDAGLKPEYVTSDKPWRDYLVAHPLATPIGSVILFDDMLKRGLRLLDPKFLAPQNKDIPILIVHGQDDKINDVQGSRNYEKVSPAKDLTLKEYKGANHSLFIESPAIYNLVLADIKAWLQNH